MVERYNPQITQTKEARYCLKGEICPHCKIAIFPPNHICKNCGENTTKESEVNFTGKGEVYSYTTINNPEDALKSLESMSHTLLL